MVDLLYVSGGIGSPRLYGGVTKEQQQTLLSPSHPRGGCQTTPTHNQHNVTNQNQHFTNQQHSMLYRQTGNSVSNHDVQKNQFCYEQGSVSVYSSGAEDPRSMSSSNPVNHQMGGKSCDPLMSCDNHLIIICTEKKNTLPLSFLNYNMGELEIQCTEIFKSLNN